MEEVVAEYMWFNPPDYFEAHQFSSTMLTGDEPVVLGYKLYLRRTSESWDPYKATFIGTAAQQHITGDVFDGLVLARYISFKVRWSNSQVGEYQGELSTDGVIRGNTHRIDPAAHEPVPVAFPPGSVVPTAEYVQWWSDTSDRWIF